MMEGQGRGTHSISKGALDLEFLRENGSDGYLHLRIAHTDLIEVNQHL
jgi:hypothetical protein